MNNLNSRIEGERFTYESTEIERLLRKKGWQAVHTGGRYLSSVAYILPADVSLKMTREETPRVAMMKKIFLNSTASLLVNTQERNNHRSCWCIDMNKPSTYKYDTKMILLAFREGVLSVIKSANGEVVQQTKNSAWNISSLDGLALMKEKK